MKKIVLTYGDINGIGFEVMVKALNFLNIDESEIVIVGAAKVFDFYVKKYNLKLNKRYEIVEVPVEKTAFEIGKENIQSGEHCFLCLKKACELILDKKAKNIVTGTVSKHVLNMAGYNFSGQTEIIEKFLAQSGEKSEMLFSAGDFRVLLLTRHVALKNVPESITKESLIEKINRLNTCLKNNFKIKCPRIGVLALNPHAGESGVLGVEELQIISPALNYLRDKGVNVDGPLVADAAFAQLAQSVKSGQKPNYDCYAAMYHDQGLIPMKLFAGDCAVNTTIGLSAIRTSPSHGTAFDIAGKNIARYDSMVAAIELALKLQ